MSTTTQKNGKAQAIELEKPLLDQVLDNTIDKLDSLANRYSEELAKDGLGRLRRAALMANAVESLRKAFTPEIMTLLKRLMNTPLGFLTDKDPSKGKSREVYADDVIRDAAIEALLHGVWWTGNEFNIIASRCYITREGYTRKLRDTLGFTDFHPAPGTAQVRDGKTVIRFAARWKLFGQPDSLTDQEGKPGRVFEIPVNQYTGPDAIVGKATRKAYKAIFEQIHGSEKTPIDPESETLINGGTVPTLDDLSKRITAAKTTTDTRRDCIPGEKPGGESAAPAEGECDEFGNPLPPASGALFDGGGNPDADPTR